MQLFWVVGKSFVRNLLMQDCEMVVFCFFLIGATKERVSKTCHFTALLIQSVSGFLIFKIQ